jgi:ATP-dependent protease Clp ATPase subunit
VLGPAEPLDLPPGLEFAPDGVEVLADFAFEVNRTTQNIGARRLHTILERVVEEVCFEAPGIETKHVRVDAAHVRGRREGIPQTEDLSRFIRSATGDEASAGTSATCRRAPSRPRG